MTMALPKKLPCFLSFFSLWCGLVLMAKEEVRVGVILDNNSTVGGMAKSCTFMALGDFYDENAHYKTRLHLLPRDSNNDVVAAAAAAIDLMANEEVQAIVGPQRSSQARFVTELGAKAGVPIISFSATSPSLRPLQSPYFVRTAIDDSAQVKAIAALVQAYGWRDITIIYEDTDYGNGIIPYLTDAFQENDVRVANRSVIPLLSSDTEVSKKLENLKAINRRIFLVHMTASMASKLFVLAKNAGMMSEGYAWIVTQGLSTLLDPVSTEAMDSLLGVLGVRPHIPMSKKLESFKVRWKKTFKNPELNLFGLWAYDTVWAIADAVEKAGIVQNSKPNVTKSRVDLATLGISETGPRLISAMLSSKFQGLSGNFSLVKGQLEQTTFEVFNVIGRTERILGYWTPTGGLVGDLTDNGNKVMYSTSMNKLKKPIWPGDTFEQPKKLRIGVPVRDGFNEFIKVKWDQDTNKSLEISGFSPDVFRAVVNKLPFPLPYEFIPFVRDGQKESAGTYDDLLREIYNQKFDAVVGDTTIVASRDYVDFTLPYSESGVSMVVLVKDDQKKNMWIFLKPLSWDLWLTTGVAFLFTGVVIWILEHRLNTEFRGPPHQQLGTIFWFSFSTLVFAHREKVVSNLSRFILVIWMFLVLILTQSYTASLASMLTVQRLQPSFNDVQQIQRNDYLVGYQNGSFVKDLLIKQLNFNESRLIGYSTPEEYHEALSNGSKNGGVAAIFDEIPFINLFLDNYGSRYTTVGPTYRTDGFAFAFPLKSPLVSYMSRAILNVTEDKETMDKIIRDNFGIGQNNCNDQVSPFSSSSLDVYSFGGLFIITGVASLSSLLIYIINFLYLHWHTLSTDHPEGTFWSKIVKLAKDFDQKDLSSHRFKKQESRVHPETVPNAVSATADDHDNLQNHSETLNGEENVVRDANDEDSVGATDGGTLSSESNDSSVQIIEMQSH